MILEVLTCPVDTFTQHEVDKGQHCGKKMDFDRKC